MRSLGLLLICVVAAAAVPIKVHPPSPSPSPSPKPPAPKPPQLPGVGLDVVSKQKQKGFTQGGAAVSSSGSTQGAGSLDLAIDGPGGFQLRKKVLVNAGVSGAAAAAGDSGYQQQSQSQTSASGGLGTHEVETSSQGTGGSFGAAGVTQKQGANGGVSGAARFGGKAKNGAKLGAAGKGSATSSSGLDASSSGNSQFAGLNSGKSSVNFIVPSLDDVLPGGSGVAPNIGVDAQSELKQKGATLGDASVSTKGGTQAGGSLVAGLRAPGLNIDGSAAAQSGAAGAGALYGEGTFKQETSTGTSARAQTTGLRVTNKAVGRGVSTGKKVGTEQRGSTGGGISGSIVTGLGTPDGKFSIKGQHKGSAKGSAGVGGSTNGAGSFTSINVADTKVTFDVPSPNLALPGHQGLPSAPADTPVFKLTSASKLLQQGGSEGGGAASGVGATQGAGLGTADIDTPHLQLDGEVAANSGVSGATGSKGHGVFAQIAQAQTDATANADGIETRSRTQGRGQTKGHAVGSQKAGANGAIKAGRDLEAIVPAAALGDVAGAAGKGKKTPPVKVGSKAKGSAASSSGHQASSQGDGIFKTDNDRGTKIKLTDPFTG